MNGHEAVQMTQAIPLLEPTAMTLEEFLASDVDGYEYAKGELVPMNPLTRAR